MRILIERDVLLDFAITREPSLADSKRVLAWARDYSGEAARARLSSLSSACALSRRVCEETRNAVILSISESARFTRSRLAFPSFGEFLNCHCAEGFPRSTIKFWRCEK